LDEVENALKAKVEIAGFSKVLKVKKKAYFDAFLLLTLSGTVTNKLFTLVSIKIADHGEASSARRSFVSKIKIRDMLTRSFAWRLKLRFAQPF